MNTMNAINWFEIPCTNFERAAKFYEAVLATRLERVDAAGGPHGIFPTSGHGVGGALVIDKQNAPAAKGSRVYLDATGKLDACLERVPKNGGEIVVPKTSIAPHGFLAIVRDTEGNHVGLHSPT
jgi:predicted enzyme related to lactoylglutathione lyase